MRLGREAFGASTSAFSVIGLGDQQKPARLQRCDPRQGRMDEPRPLRAQDARLQPQLLRKPQHVLKPNSRAAEAMRDLALIGRHAMQAQQRHKGQNAIVNLLASDSPACSI